MTTDPMNPTTSLTPEERSRAREIAQQNPEALWPAVEKALGHLEHGEEIVERVLGVIRGVR